MANAMLWDKRRRVTFKLSITRSNGHTSLVDFGVFLYLGELYAPDINERVVTAWKHAHGDTATVTVQSYTALPTENKDGTRSE